MLTGMIIGLMALAVVLIAWLLWTERGHRVRPDDLDEKARRAVAAHEREAQRRADRGALNAEEMLRNGSQKDYGIGAGGMGPGQ